MIKVFLDSSCWKKMKKVSLAFCNPKYDKNLPTKFGKYDYEDFWTFGRDLVNFTLGLGDEFGEFEDDTKTDFGLH
jgi:hypothetical protein